jgi:Family of unknown function (DUF6266)
MARLTGPLFSLSASGKIANTLVYADWKGVSYVRSKVTPANPNTAAQQVQRARLTTALTNWHNVTEPVGPQMVAALDRAANFMGRAMSGFNLFVMNTILTLKAGAAIIRLSSLFVTTPTLSTMAVVCYHPGLSTAAVAMRYGTSPTSMPIVVTRTEAGTPGLVSNFAVTGLSAATIYYGEVYSTISGSHERTGIFKATTPAS